MSCPAVLTLWSAFFTLLIHTLLGCIMVPPNQPTGLPILPTQFTRQTISPASSPVRPATLLGPPQKSAPSPNSLQVRVSPSVPPSLPLSPPPPHLLLFPFPSSRPEAADDLLGEVRAGPTPVEGRAAGSAEERGPDRGGGPARGRGSGARVAVWGRYGDRQLAWLAAWVEGFSCLVLKASCIFSYLAEVRRIRMGHEGAPELRRKLRLAQTREADIAQRHRGEASLPPHDPRIGYA